MPGAPVGALAECAAAALADGTMLTASVLAANNITKVDNLTVKLSLKFADSTLPGKFYQPQAVIVPVGVDPTNPVYALARLGMGRAYALQGKTAKAKTAYQDFLAAWKDADPDVPILKEAKAEYAKLQ